MNRTLLLVLALVALHAAVLSCSPKKTDMPPATLAPVGRSQVLIDSGNASFRRAEFENAAKRYASATLVNPNDPAAYYGLGMALAKLGRDADARTAYAKSRALAGPAADSAFSQH